MAVILLMFKGMVKQEFPLTNPITTIGRTGNNDILIDNLAVSRNHAQIQREGDGYLIEDLGSNNGTYVNGQRVQKQPLKDGDEIVIGKHQLRFELRAGNRPLYSSQASNTTTPSGDDLEGTFLMDASLLRKSGAASQAPTPAAPASGPAVNTGSPAARAPTTASAPPPPAATKKGYLVVLQGALDRQEYDLSKPATTIGKDAKCDVRLSGFLTPNMAMVINRRPDGYYVTPSAGGWVKSHLNGQPLGDQRKLDEGDVVEVRDYKFQLALR